MADRINGTGSNKQINPNRPTEEAVTPQNTNGADAINPDHVERQPRGDPKPRGDRPYIRKPTNTTPPTEAELKAVISYLQEFAKQLKENVHIDRGNVHALLNLYKNMTPKELTSEDLSQTGEILANKSPEELSALLDLALTKYAIGEDGKFTEKFKAFLENPPMGPPPSGPNQEEAYSFFTLMLLLNKLSSSQRDTLFKGMQLEQKGIQASFKLKIDNISNKAFMEIMVALGTVAGGALSLGGTAFGAGLASTTSWKPQTAQALGKLISDVAGTGGSAGVRLQYDPEREKIEASSQQANFSKDIYSQSRQVANEQLNAADQAAQDFNRQLTSAKSGIAQRMA